MQWVNLLLAIGAAYLIGSVPFAVIVSRAMGLADPRTYGSGNPGATNVLRSGNKWAAALTLLGDGFKGWLAVWLALRFGSRHGIADAGVALVAIAVVLGHLYPIFLRFRGGKGVATAAGVIIALESVAGAGNRHHLGDRCSVLSLLIAGVDRSRCFRAVLFGVRMGIRRALCRAGRHCRVHGVSP